MTVREDNEGEGIVAGTRERILAVSGELLRRQGFAATGMKQIVSRAGAPFGSVYHHFPGGKDELAEEVIRTAGAFYAAHTLEVFDAAPDVVSAVDAVFAGAAETLVATDYADACPIATVALEVASTHEPLRQATAEVFTSWFDTLVGRFRAAGIAEDPARELAWTFLAALEGAFVLARALRVTDPLLDSGSHVARAVRAALPPGQPRTPASA